MFRPSPSRPPEAESPAVHVESTSGHDHARATAPRVRRMPLYPNCYVWFVFVSALDIMLTWKIVFERAGEELNPVARNVIELWGLPGAIAFKFGITILVIIICEIVGRARSRTGHWLARAAVAISAIPVAYSLALLTWHVLLMPMLAES